MAKKKKSHEIEAADVEGLVRTIRQCAMENQQSFFNDLVGNLSGALGISEQMFVDKMAFHSLLEAAKYLIMNEWNILYSSASDLKKNKARWISEGEEYKEVFVKRYDTLFKKFGTEVFNSYWKNVISDHNKNAKANLESSKGCIYCYILPEINSDGSHGFIAKEDGPWGQIEKKPRKKHDQG